MKNSDFTVKCPYCGKINDFVDDDWCDDLIDDSDTTELDCLYCDYPMDITTHAVYKLEVAPYKRNVDLEDPHDHY